MAVNVLDDSLGYAGCREQLLQIAYQLFLPVWIHQMLKIYVITLGIIRIEENFLLLMMDRTNLVHSAWPNADRRNAQFPRNYGQVIGVCYDKIACQERRINIGKFRGRIWRAETLKLRRDVIPELVSFRMPWHRSHFGAQSLAKSLGELDHGRVVLPRPAKEYADGTSAVA